MRYLFCETSAIGAIIVVAASAIFLLLSAIPSPTTIKASQMKRSVDSFTNTQNTLCANRWPNYERDACPLRAIFFGIPRTRSAQPNFAAATSSSRGEGLLYSPRILYGVPAYLRQKWSLSAAHIAPVCVKHGLSLSLTKEETVLCCTALWLRVTVQCDMCNSSSSCLNRDGCSTAVAILCVCAKQ